MCMCMYVYVHCERVHEYVYILQSMRGNENAVLGVGLHFPPCLKQGLFIVYHHIYPRFSWFCLLLTIEAPGLQMSANTPNGDVNSGPHG